LALDPARRALYVANTGQDTQKFTVSVVDVTTWKVTATIPFENNQPSAVAVDPSTHLL
jgi:YVTN family beta-propeller protein